MTASRAYSHTRTFDSVEAYTLTRQRMLQKTLKTHGVLTRAALFDFAHADSWRVPFDLALQRALRSGRVIRLTDDLFEAGHEER